MPEKKPGALCADKGENKMGMKAEQWRQIILSFESKKTYNNPFLDVSIWSVFTGPSGRRIRREAYWDGGNTYRIAFAPTENRNVEL